MHHRAPLIAALFALLYAGPAGAGELPWHDWRATLATPPAGVEPALGAAAVLLDRGDSTAALARIAGRDDVASLWMRARILRGRGDAAAASRAMEQAADRWPQAGPGLTDPGGPWAAFDHDRLRAALDAGDLAVAERAAGSPLVTAPGHPLWLALLSRLSLARGDTALALAQAEAAWEAASPRQREDSAFAALALARLAAGAAGAGAAWADWVAGLDDAAVRQRAWPIYRAHPALADRIVEEGEVARAGRWLVRIAQREELLRLARRAVEHGEEPLAASMLVAEQLYRLRRHDELSGWLSSIDADDLDRPARAELAGYAAGLLRREGERSAAAAAFDALGERFAPLPRAAEALWEAAWMHELEGDLERARDRFERCLRMDPDGRWARPSALRLAWLDFEAGGDPDAGQVGRWLDRGWQEDAFLWLRWRHAERQGDARAAAGWRERLEERSPWSPFLHPPAVPLERAVAWPGGHARLAGLLREALGEAERALGVEGHDWLADERLRHAQLALELGHSPEADRRLLEALDDAAADPVALLGVAQVAAAGGRTLPLLRAGLRLRPALLERDPQLLGAAERIAHPVPFADAVLEACAREELPPGLVLGLVRRESLYEAGVVSLAGAWGLMQLMPPTAARMAEALGEERAPRPVELAQPLRNLRYGTHYLSGLLEEFGGDPWLALAAYNAGEPNAARWDDRRREGSPPAELALLISYTETRAYVVHVQRFAQLYETLYGPPAPAGPGR